MMKAVVQVCGSVDPSLAKMVSATEKSLGKINVKAAAVSAAVVGGVGVAVKEMYNLGKASVENAAGFQTEMQNVATLLDGTDKEIADRVAGMQKEILSVSNTTGVATSELTEGMYQVVSAFGDSKDSIGILETASKSARAGNATTIESINLLSAVTKAYGDTSQKAIDKVSDLSFEAVKLGQTTYPELASSMGKVTSGSASLGVSQEELFGVFATGTGVVGTAAEVATQLKAIYTNLRKPNEAMVKAMKSLGYSSANAMIETLGLQGTLKAFTKYSNEKGINLALLYGSAEALGLAESLTGENVDVWEEKTNKMLEATGATQKAYSLQEKTLEAVQGKISNLLENTKTEIGMSMLPMLLEVAETALPEITDALDDIKPVAQEIFTTVLEEGVPWLIEKIPEISDFISEAAPVISDTFNGAVDLFDYLKENSDVITAIGGGVLTLVGALGLFNTIQTAHATVTGIATAAETAFGIATGTALAPILLITAGIAAVVAVGILLYKNWDKISAKASELWQKFTEFAHGVRDSFVTAFEGLSGIVSQPINSVISLINNAINSINELDIKIPDWVPVLGGKEYSLNIAPIPMLATGGFTNGPSIAGEVPGQTEAVISFLPSVREENLAIWQKAGEMLGANKLTPLQKAGQLITLDDFSLGDIGATTIIYYDFSDFHYNPEINNYGNDNSNDTNIIKQLEENKYEFADWFLEWMELVTQED